ncbi:hypothetical protein [Clostridium fallax]|uniref:Uncharacterized protein n=1 Tax=Clostridium fallax TaxID=1533 RepID=A0A1M4U9F9_9CLOT|nr:hypothetical protein [Clostridium fallax]SHE53288.1 hypothetical protein SAMN05443638_104102 [Clostridium fallax]SQB06144.1 Uncharacterised protein [Clostridium fallax]
MRKLIFRKFKGEKAYYREGFSRKKCSKDKFPFYIKSGEVFIFNNEGEAILLREESIERFKSINLRWIYGILSLIFISIIGALIVFVVFPLNFNMVYKNNFGSKKFLEEGENFLNIRADIKNNAYYKEVKDFNIREDTFQFKNISTESSPLGNCFGIAYTEKELFLGKLKEKVENKDNKLGYNLSNISKKIGEYSLNNDDIIALYGPPDDNTLDSREKFNLLLRKGYKPKDYTIENMYSLVFGKAPTTFNDIQDKDVKELLRTISYYQGEYFNINPKVEFLPYVLTSRLDAAENMAYYYIRKIKNFFNIDKYKIEKKINVKYITDMIDDNNPPVIAVFGNGSGHAILGYGYEWIGDDFLKVYVQDSNIPLFSDKKEFEDVNNEILKNTYILFQNINGKWYYKYDPYIKDKFIYSHKYNSFMPNGYIKIY